MIRRVAAPIPRFILASAIFFSIELLIIHSALFAWKPEILSPLIATDIIVGISLLYYFILVRTGRVPLISIFPVVLLCVRLAAFMVPGKHPDLITLLKLALPAAELVLMVVFVLKLRTVKAYYHRAL